MKIIALALLLIAASSLSGLSYSFNANSTSVYLKPSYFLGALTINSTITVGLQTSGSGFTVNIKDANNTNVIQALGDLSSTGNATWKVTANASYYLQVFGASPAGSATMYYLTATLNSTVTLLRVADILRQDLVRFFYIANGDPTSANITITASSGTAVVYSLGTSFKYSGGSSITPSPTSSSGVITYALSGLSVGYYMVVFSVPATNPVIITFPTSTYPCPYISGFSDYYGVFSGCTASTTSQPGPPCSNYDYINLKCLGCLTGYTLSNGVCMLPSNCTSRQYTHFGVCYNVNPLCDSFDAYTGDCLSCLNPTQFKLASGLCVGTTLTCKQGTVTYGDICIPNTCSAAFNNGSCTVCVSTAYYLSNGSCLPIDCGNNAYFSVKFNGCTLIPATCSKFSVLSQSCQTCINGYFLNGGVCLQPYGSANCQVWNFNSNLCDQCLPNYSYILNICQVNTTVPINCPSGQYLVNKVCVILPDYCLALNSFYICTQCIFNYQISSGKCVPCNGINPNFPCVYCPSGYFVNSVGACQPVSANCAASDTLSGLCTSCNSGVAPVNGVCCGNNENLVNGACVAQGSGNNNSSGNNDNYFAKCLLKDIVSQKCTQCLNGYGFKYADFCA